MGTDVNKIAKGSNNLCLVFTPEARVLLEALDKCKNKEERKELIGEECSYLIIAPEAFGDGYLELISNNTLEPENVMELLTGTKVASKTRGCTSLVNTVLRCIQPFLPKNKSSCAQKKKKPKKSDHVSEDGDEDKDEVPKGLKKSGHVSEDEDEDEVPKGLKKSGHVSEDGDEDEVPKGPKKRRSAQIINDSDDGDDSFLYIRDNVLEELKELKDWEPYMQTGTQNEHYHTARIGLRFVIDASVDLDCI